MMIASANQSLPSATVYMTRSSDRENCPQPWYGWAADPQGYAALGASTCVGMTPPADWVIHTHISGGGTNHETAVRPGYPVPVTTGGDPYEHAGNIQRTPIG